MAHPLTTRDSSADDRGNANHPWIRALESFSIAFMCYAGDGSRRFASPAAEQLTRDPRVGDRLADQADRVVATQLAVARPRLQIAQFARVGEVAALSGVTLSVYLAARLDGDLAAVVVFHPRPATSMTPVATGATMLTDRERQIAAYVASGRSTKEVAGELGISAHTVRHHTERVFAKLGVRSRASLAALMAVTTD